MAIDYMNPADRKMLIEQINSDENASRKRNHQRRFDVYRDRQDNYIIEKLEREFNRSTVDQMRKILSLGLSKRVIDEMSSVYTTSPDRTFINATEREEELLEMHYKWGMVDTKMRSANRWNKLHDQCAIQVLPMDGYLEYRVLQPHQYDVVPMEDHPEKAEAYIINVWDLDFQKSFREGDSRSRDYFQNDRLNQRIADDNDRDALQERYIVWTADVHYTMDGRGNLIGEVQENPLGMLPFIDVASEKDFQFFVRRGSSVTEFSLDFAMVMSDLANISRLQGYSQAIIFSEEQPKDMVVGPNHILHLPLDPNRPELNPRFEFVSPTPDLAGSLQILETMLRVFLSSRGVDTSAIATAAGQQTSFQSGVDRLLSMLDKFEATREDFDLFKYVERELCEITIAWHNALQGVRVEDGGLVPELQGGISPNVYCKVDFHTPEAIQSEAEKLANIQKKLDMGLISQVEAIAMDRDMTKEEAEEVMREIEMLEPTPVMPPQLDEPEVEDDEEQDG